MAFFLFYILQMCLHDANHHEAKMCVCESPYQRRRFNNGWIKNSWFAVIQTSYFDTTQWCTYEVVGNAGGFVSLTPKKKNQHTGL